MAYTKADLDRFVNKMNQCTSMTNLLVAMSSWQSFADNNGVSAEEREVVDKAYLDAEARLIGGVKPSLW